METIQAVVVDPAAPGRLRLADVESPHPLPSEALVRVAAVSLNRGEIRRAQSAEPGWRPGWDLAGTVERAAEDGSGPPAGTRVVATMGTRSGAWAEQAAVPTRSLATLPDGVSFSVASTLPIAGLTALVAVEKYPGGLLGRNVLVTGASGGAGNFAIQLARAAGAHVVALIRRPQTEAMVRAAGAHEVVLSEDGAGADEHGPYDLVIDSVGGQVLGNLLGTLAPNGMCVNFGTSGGARVSFDMSKFYPIGGASLYGLIIFYELEREGAGPGLKRLLDMVEDGRLDPHIDVEASWTEAGIIAQRLQNRDLVGKAVLKVAS